MTVRATVQGLDRLKAKLRALEPLARKPVMDAINASALAVEREAKISVQRGSRSGRIYRKYNPRRTHQASAPGEPPKTDTGYLVSHITTVLDSDGLGAQVESRARYSKALEFGSSKMAARPFLFPAFEKLKGRIRKHIGNAVNAAFKKAGR